MDNLNVYPNPVSDKISIDMPGATNVQVYSVVGAKIIDELLDGQSTLNVSSLTNGVYILKVTDIHGKLAVAKFNKE